MASITSQVTACGQKETEPVLRALGMQGMTLYPLSQQDDCVLQLTPLRLQDSHVKNRKTVLDEQQL